MINNRSTFLKLEQKLAPEYILKKNPAMQKLARELRLAISRAGLAGAKSMRETILNSPTGTIWHERKNIWRAANKPAINGKDGSVNNDSGIGARLDSGNMYNSVSRKYGKVIPGKDKRYQQEIVGGFGWPADSSGNIKDAPSSPMSRSRDPDPVSPSMKPWRSDPNYFAIQEYEGRNPMNSQEKASAAAQIVLDAELAKIKRK
jgi:hypothetical protein